MTKALMEMFACHVAEKTNKMREELDIMETVTTSVEEVSKPEDRFNMLLTVLILLLKQKSIIF